MSSTKELSLKIEDLEERIAPHIQVWLPSGDVVEAHPQAAVHADLGPNASPEWHMANPGTEIFK